MFDGWVTLMVVAPQEVLAAQLSGESRDAPPHSSLAVRSGIREYTKATPSPPSSAPRPLEGGKGLALHDTTAGVRQDDAGTTRKSGPSQPFGELVPEGPFSEPLPREEIIHVN